MSTSSLTSVTCDTHDTGSLFIQDVDVIVLLTCRTGSPDASSKKTMRGTAKGRVGMTQTDGNWTMTNPTRGGDVTNKPATITDDDRTLTNTKDGKTTTNTKDGRTTTNTHTHTKDGRTTTNTHTQRTAGPRQTRRTARPRQTQRTARP